MDKEPAYCTKVFLEQERIFGTTIQMA